MGCDTCERRYDDVKRRGYDRIIRLRAKASDGWEATGPKLAPVRRCLASANEFCRPPSPT